LRIHRRLSGPERMRIGMDMSLAGRAMCKAGLHREHPDWTEVRLQKEILRYAFQPGSLPPPLQ